MQKLGRCRVKAPLVARVVGPGCGAQPCTLAHDIREACRQCQGLWFPMAGEPSLAHCVKKLIKEESLRPGPYSHQA